MTDRLRANANLIDSLGSAARHGGSALADAPVLLRRVLEEEAWREFITQRGDHVVHQTFVSFVATPPLKGLGSDIDLIRRIASGDSGVLDLLDRAVRRPVGSNQHTEPVDNINKLDRPSGTSKTQALRKLRKDAPELHEQVVSGRLTAHAAMVEAGFRPKMLSVRLDDPVSIARALHRNLPSEDFADLVTEAQKLLVHRDDDP